MTHEAENVVDYRALLVKYISLVGNAEGTDFIAPPYRTPGVFSDEEWDELNTLAEEAML